MITILTFPIPFGFIITSVVIFLIIACLCYLLMNKQIKFTKTLKPGDKVYFGEFEGELIEKGEGNQWIIKTSVSDMRLSKKD